MRLRGARTLPLNATMCWVASGDPLLDESLALVGVDPLGRGFLRLRALVDPAHDQSFLIVRDVELLEELVGLWEVRLEILPDRVEAIERLLHHRSLGVFQIFHLVL